MSQAGQCIYVAGNIFNCPRFRYSHMGKRVLVLLITHSLCF